ncbi:MAG: 2-dehydropantoate 2-reductase [Luteitalea sp.]|nr:2-dehydropantoate 2-reductase [Luteitalea sp.]
MRIAILGSGGVGGYFGGRLAATGADVHFIARGAHLAALRERGLRIESPNGNLHVPTVNATDDPTNAGPVDIVFFAVKLYDTDAAVRMLPPLIGPRTIVIPLQNGVDAVEVLARAIGKPHVAGGTAYVSAVIAEPGRIRHTAMSRLLFGPLPGQTSGVLKELADACAGAGFEATLSERIVVEIWTKFVGLTVFSGMTAITRCPIGPVRADPELRAIMETALHESITVARGRQVPLPASTFSDVQAATAALPANARSSMLEDLERGRPLELPWLSGAVVRIAEEVGAKVPTHRLIVSLLRPHVAGRESG